MQTYAVETSSSDYLLRQCTDDDLDLIAEAEAVLDRLACGQETTLTLDEVERLCDALDD